MVGGWNFEDKQLISLIRDRSIIYETVYKRTKQRNEEVTSAWVEVSALLGTNKTPEACRKRWKAIRDSYVKFQNKLKSQEPWKETSIYYKKYFDGSLSFLDGVIVRRKRSKSNENKQKNNATSDSDIEILETELEKNDAPCHTYVTQDMIEKLLKHKKCVASAPDFTDLQVMSVVACSDIEDTINKYTEPDEIETALPITHKTNTIFETGVNQIQVDVCKINNEAIEIMDKSDDEDAINKNIPIKSELGPSSQSSDEITTRAFFREMGDYVVNHFPPKKQLAIRLQIWSLITDAEKEIEK